jgi:class 3 adenylate cyclase
MSHKTVVELDLVGYSDLARALEENVGVEVVFRLNEQIQQFVDIGLAAVRVKREQVVLATAGDSAIVAFDKAGSAHRFATAVHRAAEAHNEKRTIPSAKRWFRVGIATGELDERPRPGGGREVAGTVIANAVRLEAAARPGQIVADRATFQLLPANLRKFYGREETVRGKRSEEFAAHRATVLAYSTKEKAPATIESVLDLFDRLNPRDQLNRLMNLSELPQQFRPSKMLTLFERQDAVLDWAAAGPGLEKLSSHLKWLIERQQ